METLRYRIFGRVQGVAFRAFVRDKANRLGLSGWVKNKTDGSVECLVSDHAEQNKAFAAALKQGPRWAVVESVEVESGNEPVVGGRFEIRYE